MPASAYQPDPPAAARASAGPHPQGRNLALGRPVTSSGMEGPAWPASATVDDDGTRWRSGFSDPQWIQVDLGQLWRVDSVTLYWEHAHATAYRAETSRDGRTWTTRYATENGTGGTVTLRMPGVDARYLRMYGTRRVNQYGCSLLELEVR
ncbi:discoidin domain-containing protein [Solwaraspora sp. WMMD406]|uniref:discoidin domain-containing protein n=1 Tax=Solwaraspora sp. WMMD406 TaxID=3016095 RepID=UPI0024170299|nr:discoidin domain-containing protein [Solwaraspora sp. WMMD406]MDG4764949.1 discoidin domain-containing protein [Solwaraspora sp. WMMD406]